MQRRLLVEEWLDYTYDAKQMNTREIIDSIFKTITGRLMGTSVAIIKVICGFKEMFTNLLLCMEYTIKFDPQKRSLDYFLTDSQVIFLRNICLSDSLGILSVSERYLSLVT